MDVATAFSLSGAAGLNAWIPLLAAGLLDRAGQLQLASPYDALATTPGLIVVGVLFVLDFVGDKVPAVDSVLHAVGSVVHPASGAILFAGSAETPTDIPSIVLFALGAPTRTDFADGTWAAGPAVAGVPQPTPSNATGDVSLIADLGGGMTVGFDTLTLGAGGIATGTTTALPGGTSYLIHAHYTGDGTNAPSDSAPPVSVTTRAPRRPRPGS